MNLRDLRYAVAVDDLQHFGRAAEACRIGQPTLSAQLRKLEDHLGVDLFERTKRSVRTTPAGALILAEARQILEIVGRMEALAAGQTDPLSGPLHLGIIPTIGPYLTPILLPSVRHSLSSVTLELSENKTETLEKLLLSGALDAAILATPPADSNLDSIPLFTEPFRIALPRGHPLESQDDIALEELADDTLLLLEDGHCLSDQIQGFCRESRGSLPKTQQTINTRHTSLMTITALVGAGMGVSLVPALSLQGSWVTDSGVILRKERTGTASRLVRLTFRRSYPRRELMEKMADLVAAIVPDTVFPVRR